MPLPERTIRALEEHLAEARAKLERMVANPDYHTDEDVALKRAEIRATEDVLRIVRGEEGS